MFCDEEVRLKLSFDHGNLFHRISYLKKMIVYCIMINICQFK